MKQSFLGYSKNNNIPLLLKIILFLAFSITPFLNISIFLKFALILFLILYRFFILNINKNSLKIFFFLIISSLMIILFWMLFEKTNLLEKIINALMRLWILFLSGNVLLITVNQEEVINYLKKINCSSNIILFIIVSMNSLCYFIYSFKEIVKSYNARNSDSNILKKYFYALRTISIDCLFLIVECKKIYTIYYDNIITALEGEKNDAEC